MRGEWQWRLFLIALGFGPQLLARSCYGEAFLVEELLDPQDTLNIFAPIHALAGAALYRLQLRKFRLPKTQHVRRQAAQAGNFADAKVELLRNHHLGGLGGLRGGFAAGAHEIQKWRLSRETIPSRYSCF